MMICCCRKRFATAVSSATLRPGITDRMVFFCGVCTLKQAGDTEGEQRSGHGSCGDSHRHHQQHVLRDSEACRPSLKPFPEVAPAASTMGMRLPLKDIQVTRSQLSFH